ncbi:hypothetical protein [Allonocardiopsis opalescens]|uniref:GH15 family glucan-1,4-alpha-glucosidase n=1 Tax=Allonocardiopsis opalescens TaxID=1144618 RepID=A0A2T0QAW4_9ACTN|nr:hypothetical protein [Allonocardiopsis opalescens]PRY00951.1 hypothetical protein CLV72_102584 [Allonocardiopsis opalescens]
MTGGAEEALGTAAAIRWPETRLYSDGVVVGADGFPVVMPPGSSLRRIEGTGYLDPASGTLPGAAVPSGAEVAAARAALAAARVPGAGTRFHAMAATALTDIGVLLCPNGAVVAAGSPYWRYVWPRDAGFIAVALVLAGRRADALRALRYVADRQEADGTWQARYLPDGSGGVPDDRGVQLDGIGWTLWAAWALAREPDAPGLPGGLLPMVAAAVRAAVAAVDATGVPRASQDYWETDIDEATLGSAAPLLLGLRTGRELLREAAGAEAAELAAAADATARRLSAAIDTHFAPAGYPRRVSGGGRDASVAFLLPPFAPRTDAAEAAWRATLAALTLPNGGVRPGEEWTDAETGWTPQQSLFAMTAATLGDRALAERLLDWLRERVTRLGALPEKVTARGEPAAVAPLGLTAASVLIALYALEGRKLPVPEP